MTLLRLLRAALALRTFPRLDSVTTVYTWNRLLGHIDDDSFTARP
jgi:hypothetical protein